MERRYKEAWVKGLLIDCPFGKPLDSCPAREFRRLPLKERMARVDAMTEAQLDAIIEHHQQCLHEREK